MFWLRVLAIAQVAILVRHHATLLERDERNRLAGLVAKSQGRPRKNLTANERDELLRLAQKLEPGAFAHGVWGAARGKLARQARRLATMALKRVIPCLDVDAGRVVKGTNFVDIRDAGDPVELAERYDAEGADELVFLDITASHEKRDTIIELARRTADNVFIPFTIGGGIRSVADAQAVLDAGADKVAVNSSALARPELISELAVVFGSQCVVVAIDAKERRRVAPPLRVRGDAAAALRRLRQRRPHAGRGPRGGRLGARGDRARGGGGAADEHGPRRDHRRLRPRADPRGRRRGRGAGDRLGRRRRARAPGRGRRPRAAPTRCSRPRSSTTASTRSPRRRRRCARPGSTVRRLVRVLGAPVRLALALELRLVCLALALELRLVGLALFAAFLGLLAALVAAALGGALLLGPVSCSKARTLEDPVRYMRCAVGDHRVVLAELRLEGDPAGLHVEADGADVRARARRRRRSRRARWRRRG